MGLVLMSERELNRLEVLGKVIEGRMTVRNAANLLSLSEAAGLSAGADCGDRRCRCYPSQSPRPPFQSQNVRDDQRVCYVVGEGKVRGFWTNTGG